MISCRARRRLGYTLAEMMLVVAIVGIVASTGAYLLMHLNDFYQLTQANNDIERDARQCLDTMNRYIRQAEDLSITISTPANGGPYSRIDFTTADGRSMAFYQSGDELIQVIGNTATVMSKHLAYIAFTFPQSDDPSIVSVSLTMGETIQRGQKKVLELTIEKVRVMN
ncbi:MAG: type II secretion system protein [Elusimicrobia bacterium]|nr:type II secretion system protein [Elusimicrobiota bacterium]MDE2312818.1 type II secretion system protein [Elusimicrobiota bacterium]